MNFESALGEIYGKKRTGAGETCSFLDLTVSAAFTYDESRPGDKRNREKERGDIV
jgi:hypothetical protein